MAIRKKQLDRIQHPSDRNRDVHPNRSEDLDGSEQGQEPHAAHQPCNGHRKSPKRRDPDLPLIEPRYLHRAWQEHVDIRMRYVLEHPQVQLPIALRSLKDHYQLPINRHGRIDLAKQPIPSPRLTYPYAITSRIDPQPLVVGKTNPQLGSPSRRGP